MLTKQTELYAVRTLVAMEVPWVPIRHHWKVSGAIHAARDSGGVRDPSGAGDATQRKTDERHRDALKAAGLFADNALTTEGKRLVRGWTWPFEVKNLTTAIKRIAERIDANDCRNGGWVPETLIAGAPWGASTSPFAFLQRMLLPLLADSVVESASTVEGHAYYRLPDAALYALAEAKRVISVDDFRPDLSDLYDTLFPRLKRKLLNDRERYQDIGEIPLPVSDELLSERDYEPRNIKPLFKLNTATT